jgi:hypothetical protein
LDGVEAPDRARDLAVLEVEGLARADVDEAGEAGLDQVGGGGLEHLECGDVGGGEVLERHHAGLGGEDFAAVVGGGEVRQTAHQHVLRLAALAVDLHARDARGDLRRVEIGQLGDVLGHHGIDDLVGVAADVAHAFERGSQARHHNFVAAGIRRLGSRCRGGCGFRCGLLRLCCACDKRDGNGRSRRLRKSDRSHDRLPSSFCAR